MKYLKKFESFSLNENDNSKGQSIEDVVASKMDSLSDSQLDEVKQDLLKFADSVGLSPEDLTDEEKVEAALSKAGMKLESLDTFNEGLKETWDKIKNKFYNLLFKFGIGGTLGGIITAAIGGGMQETAVRAADYSGGTVEPNTLVILGGAAAAISLIATIVGMHKMEGPKNKPTHRYRVGGGAPL